MLMHKVNCRVGQSTRLFSAVMEISSEIGDNEAIVAAQEPIKRDIAKVGRARWCQMMEPMIKQLEDLARQ